MIVTASNGHFFTQIPHPIQSSSDMEAILEREKHRETSRHQTRGNLLIIGGHFYTEFAHPDHGTGLLAFLSASLGFTLVSRHDGYPGQLVRLLLRLVVPFGAHLA